MNKVTKIGNLILGILLIGAIGLLVFSSIYYKPFSQFICEGTYVKETNHVDPDVMMGETRGRVYLLFKLNSGKEILLQENPLAPKLVPGNRVKFRCEKGRFFGNAIGACEPL